MYDKRRDLTPKVGSGQILECEQLHHVKGGDKSEGRSSSNPRKLVVKYLCVQRLALHLFLRKTWVENTSRVDWRRIENNRETEHFTIPAASNNSCHTQNNHDGILANKFSRAISIRYIYIILDDKLVVSQVVKPLDENGKLIKG